MRWRPAAPPPRGRQSLREYLAPDCSVSYAPFAFYPTFGRDMRGGWWWLARRRACVFVRRSYNAHVRVTQKDAGSYSCFLPDPAHPGPPNHAWASPVTLQILFSNSKFVSSTSLGSLQDTNPGWSKFPIYFLCEPYFLRACVLDAQVCGGLAKYEGALRGINKNK